VVFILSSPERTIVTVVEEPVPISVPVTLVTHTVPVYILLFAHTI
jgi:hypothetical protein